MDIADTTAPKSDQQNFEDYGAGPKTVTIDHVKVVGGEQPVQIHLVEYPGRPYKPGKSMRRVLVNAWGSKSAEYAGRRMTLYGDPSIKFGGQAVGGIRISALSHIDSPKSLPLTVTKGQRKVFTVQPLAAADERVTAHLEALAGAPDMDALGLAWGAVQADRLSAVPELVALKDERKKSLQSAAEESAPEEVQS